MNAVPELQRTPAFPVHITPPDVNGMNLAGMLHMAIAAARLPEADGSNTSSGILIHFEVEGIQQPRDETKRGRIHNLGHLYLALYRRMGDYCEAQIRYSLTDTETRGNMLPSNWIRYYFLFEENIWRQFVEILNYQVMNGVKDYDFTLARLTPTDTTSLNPAIWADSEVKLHLNYPEDRITPIQVERITTATWPDGKMKSFLDRILPAETNQTEAPKAEA